MRRIHVVALVALSSSGTESFVLLAGRGARWSTRPATATTLSSEERFAEELQGLPSAVDQLRAIDANGDGLGTTAPFAVVLATAAASDAPAAAVAALVGHVMARVKRAGVAVDDALRAAASREPAAPLSSQSCDHPGSPRWRPLSFARARMRNASRPSGPFPRERRPTSVVASPQPRGAATTRSSARTWPRRRPTRTRSRRWTTPP
mmetsp:Transcript_2070/g.6716  ORF Transcript_2070/g.6716 Transcript_2070/m.6716 type:complete len:206 (+) Transcript_2070:121-738(+)